MFSALRRAHQWGGGFVGRARRGSSIDGARTAVRRGGGARGGDRACGQEIFKRFEHDMTSDGMKLVRLVRTTRLVKLARLTRASRNTRHISLFRPEQVRCSANDNDSPITTITTITAGVARDAPALITLEAVKDGRSRLSPALRPLSDRCAVASRAVRDATTRRLPRRRRRRRPRRSLARTRA